MWDINNDLHLTLAQSLNTALVSMNDEYRLVWGLSKIDQAILQATWYQSGTMISCFMYCTCKYY